MDQFSLKDRVAIVTGSGRGIGAEIARTLSGAGATVTVTARTKSDVDEVASEIQAAGGVAMPCPIDVSDVENLPGLVDRVVHHLGGIDIVVNNAGGGFEWQPFLDTKTEQLEETFHFTVASPFRLCQLVIQEPEPPVSTRVASRRTRKSSSATRASTAARLGAGPSSAMPRRAFQRIHASTSSSASSSRGRRSSRPVAARASTTLRRTALLGSPSRPSHARLAISGGASARRAAAT
jgi:NAD(P)-dependent dehydrogenase (short-subunit alcohol dehydrogenase family)